MANLTFLQNVLKGKVSKQSRIRPNMAVNHGITRCLKITEKVSFNIASEAS